MPNEPLSSKIMCPYFLRENGDNTCLFCSKIFDGQQTTRLKFLNKKKRLEHVKNFCSTKAYQGCPIAIACQEYYEINTPDENLKSEDK